jgi:hypothetical protein
MGFGVSMVWPLGLNLLRIHDFPLYFNFRRDISLQGRFSLQAGFARIGLLYLSGKANGRDGFGK